MSDFDFVSADHPGFRRTPYAQVSSVLYGVFGSDENKIDSNVVVVNKDSFKGDLPVSEGTYDPHMGTTDPVWRCETCANRKRSCPGHPGSIELNYPVKSPLYREQILKWLRVVCFQCGQLVTKKKVSADKEKLLSAYVAAARPVKLCEHCGFKNENIIRLKQDQSTFYIEDINKKYIELFNHEIKFIFEKISPEVVIKLGKPSCAHPRKFILDVIRIPPNTTRPDNRWVGNMGNRSNSSDITNIVKNIVEINNLLPSEVPEKIKIGNNLRTQYFNLDLAYFEMVKGSSAANNQVRMITNTNKPLNSIAKQFVKKEGIPRKRLMGKRAHYMCRSVITGDSNIKVYEVTVPLIVAKTVSVPMIVRPYNRLKATAYYNNRDKVYPGCVSIMTKKDGKTYRIEQFNKDYKLQDGDTVYRHLVNGDFLCMNRQPSLLYSSLAAHQIRVLEEGQIYSFGLNISACNLYNADFDGDAMGASVPRNIQSRYEVSKKSSLDNWLISYASNAARMGTIQDSVIGIAELTRSKVVVDKWRSMNILSQLGIFDYQFSFDKKSYTGRELISMVLPRINYPARKAQIYMERHQSFIKYEPDEINVVIERGNLISGILDKSTTMQDTMGSIFQIIYREYGATVALDAIYAFQQLANRFLIYRGFTIGIKDMIISDAAKRIIKDQTANMLREAEEITEKFNKRRLIPPIGVSVLDFYETSQINALEPGDAFVIPILSDLDFMNNSMTKLVYTGSKGKPANVISINGALATQTIDGDRPERTIGDGRTSPYFLRHDMSPESMGFVTASLYDGISPRSYPFVAGDARFGLISEQLSTMQAGYQGRVNIKNLESIIIDNLRRSVRRTAMLQLLYAESGVDPRKTELVKFLTVLISDKEMVEKYHAKLSQFHASYRNKNVQAALDKEFYELQQDRTMYRDIFLEMEKSNPNQGIMSKSRQMPVNVFRIVEDVIYNFKEETKLLPENKKIIDPIKSIEKTNELVNTIAYAYYNSAQEKRRMVIPEYVTHATCLLKMLIKTHLCTANLARKGVHEKLLDIIIRRIKTALKESLISPGMAMGVIAAECASEPLTQYVLGSRHRSSGGGGTKTNAIVRIKEIFGGKPTDKMKNPSMIIMLKKEYNTNKNKVQEIANNIEMMNLNKFVTHTRVFFEEYGKPVHPDFIQDIKAIKHFEKMNAGINIPNNLTKWCVHFTLDKETMIVNNMTIGTIILKLQNTYNDIFFVHTHANENIIIRCYVKEFAIKDPVLSKIITLTQTLRKTIIRGIKNIKGTHVINIACSELKDSGEIVSSVIYGIETAGTNLQDVLNNDYVDKYHTQTDSIREYEEMYGIEAARQKIIIEIRRTIPSIGLEHCTIYGDEMTSTGEITSIQRTGLAKRDPTNIGLRTSYETPVQVIENAAVNGTHDHISGVSAPLMLGSVPQIGTMYNKIIVNEKFVKQNAKKKVHVDDL
jgi:DNA-directed RNA polymerase beta' subunit